MSHGEQRQLIAALDKALTNLTAHPFAPVASPDATRKRASVALIIRISPSYDHWPSDAAEEGTKDTAAFFNQDWVRHGSPEVLFIKRAARKGDRWTSHIALPGGKRDPEDEDDLAAAVRETREEVGLDVSPTTNPNVLLTGNLPQRIVTTQWGRVPLMVLCPYVFLLTSHGTPPLRLQPTEVASCHWVPVAELLSRRNRTVKEEDVSSRFAKQESGPRKWAIRAMIGQMVFSAIQLRPSETISCTASPAEGVNASEPASRSRWPLAGPDYDIDPPLLLWGLTLGVLADFLELLPPHNAMQLWSYPTFTPWDVRLVLAAMSHGFRRRKALELHNAGRNDDSRVGAVELGLEAMPDRTPRQPSEGGIHGMSTGVDVEEDGLRLRSSTVSEMLEGYYEIVRRAVQVTLMGRMGVVLGVSIWIYMRARRK